MMTLYTVYDLTTGDIRRAGGAEPAHLPKPTKALGVVLDLKANPNTHRIDPATKLPVLRAQTIREAWRATLPTPEPEEREILLEAIKSKVTPAELTAAAATLKSRRNTIA